jgi:iron complex outermembrane receptor protein
MTDRLKERVLCFTTLMIAGCIPAQLQAAEPDATLDPLLVMADRPNSSLLLGSDLDLFQTESVADLAGLVPGFYVVTTDSRGYGDVISMRGSTNTLFFSPPAVGMMVDDVPMMDVFSYPAGLLELDQVNVLRGPQGTIYGRNGAAGMIDMTTPQPGAKNEAHFETEYGSYEAFGAKLRTGGPLGGDFSQTFQLYHQERDGYVENTTLGRATDDRSVDGGLANLYWKPAVDTEVRLRVFAERAEDGSQRLSLLGSPDPFNVQSEIAGETVVERHQVSLHGTRETKWGTFKSITAWQDWKLDPSVTDLDLMASPPGFESSSTIYQDQEMWSQEFRWESPADASPWSWRTGVFFMSQSSSGDATRAFPAEVATNTWIPFSEQTIYSLDEWNAATYGRVSYAVNQRLQLQAGARLEFVDTEIDRTKTDIIPTTSLVDEDESSWYFSPELGASYALCDNTRLFARSAIGIKPAGFSAFASTPASAAYDDETAWTNEIGAEVTLPENHLAFSVTGFWNRIDDYQVNRSDVASTDYFTLNADQVTSMGVEAEAKWQPVKGLTLQGSAGYVNAEFDSYDDPLVAGVNYDGNNVPFVPEFTGALGARYDFTSGFYAQTALRMTGATYFDEANNSDFRQGSYTCWDAEIGYAAKNFSVALFGRNLLDEEYYTFINPQITAGSPGDPQIFGVRATLDF